MNITTTSKSGKEIIIRYPKTDDLNALWQYINTISKERTYITHQGEKVTLEKEEKFLTSVIKKNERKTGVMLLAFIEGELAGVSEISMGIRTDSHIGTFGITIAKQFRGDGVGKALMSTVFETAKENLNNLEIVHLDVFAKNEKAFQMYIKYGFEEYGRLPNGVKLENGHDDNILMYLITK